MLTGRYRYRVATTGMLWWKRQVLILQLEEKHTYHEPYDRDTGAYSYDYDVIEWRDATPEEMLADNRNEPDLQHREFRMPDDKGSIH